MATTPFSFIVFADSRDGYNILANVSNVANNLNPAFVIFPGDLCSSFTTSCINGTWKPAMNGNNNNGLLNKSFVSRGNHDSGTLSSWQGLWNFANVATTVGATSYSEETYNATYSFDYANSHFVVIDLPGGGVNTLTYEPIGGVNTMSATQRTWLNQDLTNAENRLGSNLKHIFLLWHGPLYSVTTEHGSETPSSTLVSILNNHPKISAGFFGHEHVTIYAHLDSSNSRVSGLQVPIEQFTVGRAGAPSYNVVKSVDYNSNDDGLVQITVTNNGYTAKIYRANGTNSWTKVFCDNLVASLTVSQL